MRKMRKMSGCSQNSEPSSPGSAHLCPGEHKELSGDGGSSFIAGVFLQAKRKKLSIHEAMVRGLLSPGTALVLLEAQAASGLLTEPGSAARLSVREALARGLVGHDFYEKLLSAEGAVTGYTEPYTGQKISLFQAMKKGLIVKEHGIRLLQAQIATGGIIDPVRGHRVPVEVAYKRGYFDQEMNQILSDPENQTRTCFDPNTHENLTYLQLLRRCVPDPDTGLLMLQLMDKGSVLYQLSEDARRALQAARTTLAVGLFQGQSVTVWELLFSRYVPEHQREEMLRRYKAGAVSIAQMIEVLTATITGAERDNGALGLSTAKPNNEARASPPAQDTQAQEQQLRKSLKSATVRVAAGEFRGQNVSVLDLLFSRYVPQDKRQELLELYRAGILSTEQVGAVVATMVNRTEAANAARAAKARGTHRAVPAAAEDEEECSARLDEALRSTTISVPAGELQGQQVSLWDLIFSDYIPEEKREELLELYHERLLTLEQMTTVVSTLIRKKESAGRKFQISVKSSSKDPVTAAGEEGDDKSPKEEPWKTTLKTTMVHVEAAEFRGREVSLWDLLHSRYIPEENRRELLELYEAGELSLEQVRTVVTTIVTKTAAAERAEPVSGPGAEPVATEAEPTSLHGDRAWEETLKATRAEVSVGEFQDGQTSLWDLLFSDSIPEEKRQELLELYRGGTLPLEQLILVVTTLIKKKESAGRKLHITVKSSSKDPVTAAGEEGDDKPPKEELWKTTLKTTMVHVEAAEFRGREVSLWDLLHSRYIPEENRRELLELYEAGELSLEQVRTVVTTIVTRTAAAERAEPVSGPGAEPVATEAEPTPLDGDGAWEETLKATRAEVSVGEFQGTQTSLWDLLFSDSIPEEKREELLELYRGGTLPLEQLILVVTTLIKKKESAGRKFQISVKSSSKDPMTAAGEESDHHPREEPWKTTLKTTMVHVEAAEFRGREVSLWDLLHSCYIPEENRRELLELYEAGELSLEQVRTVVTTIVTRTAAAERAEPVNGPGAEPVATEAEPTALDGDRTWEETLKATRAEASVGEFQGRQVSLWDLLFSQHIPEEKRQELLELYRGGTLPLEQLILVVTTLIKKKESAGRKFQISVKSSSKDPVTAAGEEGDHHPKEEPWKTTLKTTMVHVEAAEFRGREVSLWDLLHSCYIPEENRRELLELYEAGELSLEQVRTVVTTIVTKTAAAERAEPVNGPGAEPVATEAEPTALDGDGAWEETLKATRAEVSVGEFQGTQTSLWDLLFSDSIPEEKRQELLELYSGGTLPLEQLILVVTTLIKKKESAGRKLRITVKSSSKDPVTAAGEEGDDKPPKEELWKTTLKTTMVHVETAEFRGREVSLWDLLHSRYIPEENRRELLELYEAGELSLEQVRTVVTTIVTRTAAAERGEPVSGPGAEPVATEAEPTTLDGDGAWEETLKATRSEVSAGEIQGWQVSLWDLLFSHHIPEEKRQELLELYRGGTLPIQELLSTTSSLASSGLEQHLRALPAHTMDLLRSEGSYITCDPSQERRVSVWELLSSKQVSEYRREACLDTYPSGGLTVNRITITTTITTGPQLEQSRPRHH